MFFERLEQKYFGRKYHVMETGLPPGYIEPDKQLLHVAFNRLKDYVEVDCAYNEYGINKYADVKLSFTESRHDKLRNPVWGIEYLQSKGKDGEELLKFYGWWVYERPNLPDPYAAYDELYESEKEVHTFEKDSQNEFYVMKLSPKAKKLLEAGIKEEQRQYKKDTQMLAALMKKRNLFW